MMTSNDQPPAPPVVGADTRALLLYEANKKQAVIAYALWFFVGFLGGHRFYLGRTGSAIAILILSLTVVGLIITAVWVLVDAFLIPGILREKNNELAMQLGRGMLPPS
jgi:TM2 domain-containing membrane protein YozV